MPKSPSAGGSSAPGHTSFEALMTEGVALFYREQHNDAVEYLISALVQQPTDLRARYLIALAAQLHSDEEMVERMAREAKLIDPKNPYAIACEGVRFMEYANFGRADEHFEQAVRLVPNDVDLWFGRGMLYDYAGDREKAIGAYLRVITLDSKNVSGRISLGHAYADGGDYEAAFEQWVAARELSPDTESPHARLGRSYFYAGQLDAALGELQEATAREPETMHPYFYLLSAHRHKGRADEALEVYAEIRRRFRDQPEETGGMFEQTGAWREAIGDYRRAIEKEPGDAELHYRLGECLRETGDLPAALAEYENVLRLLPASTTAHSRMADIQFRLGRYDEAIAAARRAIELDRYDQSAYTVLSDALLVQGQAAAATEVIENRDRMQQQAAEEYHAKYYGLSDT